MKMHERTLRSEPPVDRGRGALGRSTATLDQPRAAPTAAEVEEAEELISDLNVLLDAGLIEVREHLLGPVRYGLA